MNLKSFYRLMGAWWVISVIALALIGCTKKDDKGQPTAASFSSTGFFQLRDGGDSVRGQ